MREEEAILVLSISQLRPNSLVSSANTHLSGGNMTGSSVDYTKRWGGGGHAPGIRKTPDVGM